MSRGTLGFNSDPPRAQALKQCMFRTMRHHGIPVRELKIQNIGNSKCCEDVEQQEFSFTAGWNARWHSHFGKQFGKL